MALTVSGMNSLTLTLPLVVIIKCLHWWGTGSSKNARYIFRELFYLPASLVQGIEKTGCLVIFRLLDNRFIWFLGGVVDWRLRLLGSWFTRFVWHRVERAFVLLCFRFFLFLEAGQHIAYKYLDISSRRGYEVSTSLKRELKRTITKSR